MVIPAQIAEEVPPVHGTASGSALALLESPPPGLTPAQRELRQMVLDAVPAASSKLAYGHALDHLFAFFGWSANRPHSNEVRWLRTNFSLVWLCDARSVDGRRAVGSTTPRSVARILLRS